jgi:hypothetical protein
MRLFTTTMAVLMWAVSGGTQELPKRELTGEAKERWERAKAILGKPDKIELYSLSPGYLSLFPKESFRGTVALGMTEVKDADARKAVMAVVETCDPTGRGAKCHNPRHGIRVTSGEKVVELSICFEFRWVYVYLDKDDSTKFVKVFIDRAQQPALDKVLRDAKVPLPPPAKE